MSTEMMKILVNVALSRGFSKLATLPLSTLCDAAHEETDGVVGQLPERHFLPGPPPHCHLAGMASVRGSTGAT